jgi:hypothetical protein
MNCAENLSITLIFSFSRFKIFSSSNASGMVLSEVFSAAWAWHGVLPRVSENFAWAGLDTSERLG